MKSTLIFRLVVCLLFCIHAAAPASIISKTKHQGMEAYRLTDGATEAIVVPAIGRVMEFRQAGGGNWLWNAPLLHGKPPTVGGWPNWGGDKTWLAPQKSWPVLVGKNWPPDPAWAEEGHVAQELPGGKLRTTGPVSKVSGLRVIRDYYHEDGDFVIRQLVEKKAGPPLQLSIWNVSQIAVPDLLVIPRSPDSAYKDGFHWMEDATKPEWSGEELLLITPTRGSKFKIGADAPFASIAAVTEGVAFVQRAAISKEDYPDGAEGAGFPVEAYGFIQGDFPFMEMELLSPIRLYRTGGGWVHTIRWSIHQMPLFDAKSEAVQTELKRLMMR